MDLCGHATLAVAHVLKTILHKPDNEFNFKTISGELKVYVNKNQYTLDFPSSIPVEDTLPDILVKSLNIQPVKVLKSRDYILVYNTEREIRDIRINRDYFDLINLDPGGIVVTAPGISSDYVYRFFTPQSSILEDPATGNTQCSLIPYWSKAMNKTIMSSHQLSKRGGKFHCEYKGERILITGQARTYFVGTIWIQ